MILFVRHQVPFIYWCCSLIQTKQSVGPPAMKVPCMAIQLHGMKPSCQWSWFHVLCLTLR